MDYKTARNFLIDQRLALETQRNPDAFLMRLKEGSAPIPGQMTNILLALSPVIIFGVTPSIFNSLRVSAMPAFGG